MITKGSSSICIPNSIITRVLLKNRAMLSNTTTLLLSQPNQVNLNLWIDPSNSYNNVGDYLSKVVVEYVCKLHGIDPNQPVSRTKHLYAIGSLLLGYQDATIWGSGFGYDRTKTWYAPMLKVLHRLYHKTDIRAVRGPLTRDILHRMGYSCPEQYGDPAVLMPLIYEGNGLRNSRDYVVIPHYSKWEKFKGDPNLLGTFTQDYRRFIDRLLEARLVISSSLHGIILAEAYGVPAIMLKDTPSEDITKYKDWYASTGRFNFPIADSVEHALELGGTPLDYGIIQKMQADLLNSFPFDLWNE